ncbi:hypothetical protein GCM10020369_39620 [Cryptosporangium minutisporangium]|uniref:NNMT/PNMT/TEMT family protein n=1 Tax=Cryptosporangium minutisporangium TaxID=113569 RepID=A0ABP6T0Q6_9ACTN
MTAVAGTPRRAGLLRWVISLVATAASTYALDAVATAAGIALVASGLLAGLDHAWALAFLAATYLAWIQGLRTSLPANRTLLTTTGTSTNVLSKAAHDLVRRATTNERAGRIAADAGYVGSEIGKEVPYYVGAFGAVLLSDSVGSREALVFLGGANLVAAAYEYGLGRLTRAALRRRRRYASFEADWVPAEYLAGYYRQVEPDEIATIAFLVEAVRRAPQGRPMLFFGVGPTLHHVFAAAPVASEIHLADYLPANLREIQRWIDRDPAAHDWRPFVRHTLRCESGERGEEPTSEQVTAREELARAKITALIQADARNPRPIDRRYSAVVSAYCADSATADRTTWTVFMGHITSMVRPGGLFVTAALRRCRGYHVAGKLFPGADIDEDDVRAVLERDFDVADGDVVVHEVPQGDVHGYSGIVLATARRRAWSGTVRQRAVGDLVGDVRGHAEHPEHLFGELVGVGLDDVPTGQAQVQEREQ